MDGNIELILIVTMAIVAVASALVVARRIAGRGTWAAGYWWSERDRSRGPGT